MLTQANTPDTVGLAKRIRLHALRMTSLGGTSHIGSVFSMADLLAVLYGRILRIEAASPQWPNRDRFILSKGHAGAGVYAAVAECGFFDVSVLDSHGQNGSKLFRDRSTKGRARIEPAAGSPGH